MPERSILFITPSSTIGGTEKNIGLFAERLPEKGFNPSLITFMGDGSLSRFFLKRGFTVHEPSSPGFPAFSSSLNFSRRQRPDIIHSFLLRGNWFARSILPFLPAESKWIASERGLDLGRPTWKVLLNSRILQRADLVTAVSEPVRQKLIEREGLSSEKTVVLSGGLDFTGYEPKILEDSPAKPRLVVLSRLRSEKNVQLTLKAFLEYRSSTSAGSLTIYGGGAERAALEMKAKEQEIGEHTHFKGDVDEARRLLSNYDLLLLPSKEEGFPNAMLEAWQAGIPVLSTDTPGALAMAGEPPAAALATEENFAGELQQLLRSPEELEKFRRRGRERVKEFEIGNVVDKLAGIYNSLL